MNKKELISSFTDTIIIIASEANGKDPETQRRLLLQVTPFFNEILTNITPKFRHIEITKKATSQFLIAVADSINSFLLSNEDAKQLASFLQVLVTSCLAPQCPEDLTRLMTSLISVQNDPENSLPDFIPFVQKYFENTEFRSYFINNHGFETAWCAFFIEKSNILIPMFFDQFTIYPSFFTNTKFRTPIENLLNTIASSLIEMPYDKCELIITKLFVLCHDRPKEFYDIYEKVGMFDVLDKYLFAQKEESKKEFFVSYFITFSQLVPFDIDGRPNKPVLILTDVICDSLCSKELRKLCLGFFIRLTEQHKNPFKIDKISQIAVSIPHDDQESILSFADLCYNLQVNLNFDLSPIIPTLIQFCTFDLMTSLDLHKFLLVFIHTESAFSPFISSFFIPLFDGLDSKKVVQLFNQYNELYILFTHFVGGHLSEDEMIPLLQQFLTALPFFEDQQKANAVFWDSLLAKKGYMFINIYLSSIREIMKTSMETAEHTFGLLIKCALTNSMCCMKIISDNSIDIVLTFYSEFNFSTKLIMNFIAAVTMHRFIADFDFQVSTLFEKYNYLNETPDNLLYLALGLQNGQDKKNGALCFPSILHKCTPYDFKSPFDLWLCGHISLDLWLNDQNDNEKDISKFPSIIGVARQYIQPKHSEMILQNPSLLEKIFQGSICHIPLFEFPPLKCEATFDIPLYENFKTFTFWFYVTETDQSATTIATLNSSQFVLREESLFIEGKQVSNISRNSWHFIVVTFDENNGYTVFLDEEQIHSFVGKGCQNIVFGSKYNTLNWFIGGAIRVFKEILTKQKIKYIYQQSPRWLHQTGYKEILIYSPYDKIPLFKQTDLNQINTSRPVTIYSIYNYVKRSIRGATPLYIQSIQMIDDQSKYGDISSLVSTICSLQKLKISGWTNNEFSLFMSVIFNICPQITDRNLIDNISNCFIDESNEEFDWESFFEFTLDYSFFFSDIAIHIISLFFQFNVRFPIPPDTPLNTIFTNFLLSLVIMPDIKSEYLLNIYDLLQIHCKDPAQIIRAIMSYPDFANDLQDYSSPYVMKEDETVKSLLNIFLSLPVTSFTDFYVLRMFEPAESFKILEHVIKNNISRIEEAVETYKIISYCFENISYIQAWEIALSVFLKRVIRLDDIDIDCSGFDINYFPNFLRYLVPLVFVASRLNSTNFWNRLCIKLLSVANDIMKNSTNLDPKVQPLLLLMMTLGVSPQKECVFPPGPSLHSTEDVVEYSVNRGQIFPEMQPDEDTEVEPLFTADSLQIFNLAKFVPSSFYLTPTVEIQMDLKLKELSYVITEKQKSDDNILYWDDYLNRLYHQFGIEEVSEFDIENSNIIPHLSQLIIQTFQKFPQIIESILITSTQFPYKLSLYWMQHLSIETLQLPDSKDVCGISLITFVCDRLLEGWYSSLFLIILSSIFSILQKMPDATYSNSIYLCILYSMDLVHSNQVSMLGDLFVEYENVILRPGFYEKLKYAEIFISRGISLIPFLNSTFSSFWLRFLDLIESSDNFQSKWKKKVHVDLTKVLTGLRILGKEGFVEYTNHKNIDQEFWESFDSHLQEISKKNMNKMKSTVLENLNQLAQKRQESNKLLISRMEKFLVKENSFKTTSKAIAVSVRYFTRRCVLTKCELFLRKREKIISTFIPFNESSSERYSLTILSDPLYPSRRRTKSPLEYIAPDYPSGTSDSIFEYHSTSVYEYTKFPECVSCCLSSCRYRIPSILRRSPKAIHARFAGSLPVLPSLMYQIFLCICNDGKKFDYNAECSLLYGVDVIEGTIFINSKYLIFLEGDKISEGNKMFHAHSDESGLSQEIYMQFFQSNLLAPKVFTFLGHFAIVTEIQQIIAATNHLWIQRPYSVTLNYSLGYNFVLNFKYKTYSEAMYYINKGLSKFMESAPLDTPYISPIHSARLVSENLRKLTSMWTEGSLDNFTYLSLCNRFGKRCFADLTQYPVFPWVISDYTSETFPPQTKKQQQQQQQEQPETQDQSENKIKTQDINDQSESAYSATNTFDPHDNDESDSMANDSISEEGPFSLPSKSIPGGKTFLLSSIKSFFHSNTSDDDEASDFAIMGSTDNLQAKDNESENENENNNNNEDENENNNNNNNNNEISKESSSSIIHPFISNDKSIYRDLTKPMGQLGEDRAKKFDQIYEDSEHVYYYGTHYLHFGVVVYFMFRIDPFSVYSFILHHGWDHPNRIFLKVNETWLSASMKSQSDVKELIPQMYKVPDYLTNVSNFNFETQYDPKVDVDKVELPKWANNGRHFIQVMCRFLESRFVTRHLNSWIDLIFGVNSRGQGAILTKNIFHPTCYPESAKSKDNNDDYVEKQAKVTSIINFGQISPQVFTKQHPQGGRERKRRSSMNTNYDGYMDSSISDGKVHLLSNVRHLVFQRINCDFADSQVQDLVISTTEIIFASIVDSYNSTTSKIHLSLLHGDLLSSSSNLNKPYSSSSINLIAKSSISNLTLGRKRNMPPLPVPNLNINSSSASSMNNLTSTLSSAETSTQNSPRSADQPVLSVLTHAVVLPSLQTHKMNDQTLASVSLSRDGFLLCKAYIDGHVSISRLSYTRNGSVFANETEVAHFRTSLNISVCDVSSEHFVCFVACGQEVLMFDIGTNRPIKPSIKLNYKVSKISIDDEAAVVWITGGCEVTLCTISGDILLSSTLHSEITSIYASPLPEHVYNRFTCAGHADGTVSFLNFSYRRMTIFTIHKIKVSDLPVTLIKVNAKAQRGIAICDNSEVYDFEYIGSNLKPLDTKYTYECADCHSPIKSGYCCSCCNRFLCSKCVANNSIKGVKVIHFCKLCTPERHNKQKDSK